MYNSHRYNNRKKSKKKELPKNLGLIIVLIFIIIVSCVAFLGERNGLSHLIKFGDIKASSKNK